MKTIFTFILTLITTLVFAQKSTYVKTVDAFLLAGENKKVLPYLEMQIKQHPKNEELLRMLGFYNIQQKNLIAAEKYYRQALEVNSNCARCDMNLGNIFALKNDFKTALIHLEKAVKTDPKDANLWLTRGRLKEMLQDNFGALSDYNKAVELEPENANNYIQRGKYNSKNDYNSLALADFNKAISLDPKNYSGYYGRSSVYFEQQHLNEALKDINKAIELDGKQDELYISQGVIYNSLAAYDKTLISYTKAIELNPDYFLAYLNRSKTYYQLENLDASCADIQTAKRLIKATNINDPELLNNIEAELSDYCKDNKVSYYYQRAIAKYNLNQYKEAVDLYTIGLEKFPNHAMLLTFKGNALLALNENKNAIDVYQAAYANKDNLLTELKQNTRLTNASDADLQKAYSATLADIHYGLATAKINLGDFTAALEQINSAINLKKGINDLGLEVYYNLRGNVYLATAKYEMAQLDFSKSISLNNRYTYAYVNRAIATVSLLEKTKISSFSLGGKLPNQPLQVVWAKVNKTAKNSNEIKLISAVEDCNNAIKMDSKMGFAFYVRGQLKQLLNQSDYCVDLLTAKKLGQQVEPILTKNCDN